MDRDIIILVLEVALLIFVILALTRLFTIARLLGDIREGIWRMVPPGVEEADTVEEPVED